MERRPRLPAGDDQGSRQTQLPTRPRIPSMRGSGTNPRITIRREKPEGLVSRAAEGAEMALVEGE